MGGDQRSKTRDKSLPEEKREQTQSSATRTRGTRQPEDGTVALGLAPCLASGAAKGRAPDCQIARGLASWAVAQGLGKGHEHSSRHC